MITPASFPQMQLRHLMALMLFVCMMSQSQAEPAGTVWNFKQEMTSEIIRQVPLIMKSYNKDTGRFGKGTWIVGDQNVMFPLAAAWAINQPGNPYYHDPALLDTVMAAGDALANTQDKDGQWIFEKKDGSTWGMNYSPWTYSRWIRAYSLIRDAMPAARRAKWEKALRLGFEGVEKHELRHIHNIPTHHAMALYAAGKALDRPDWCTTASAFLARVAAAQSPDGYWSENQGPVVHYNMVYLDALGVYYGMSHDPAVLPALERAIQFHEKFIYPDDTLIETIDERNPYSNSRFIMNVALTFTPDGRAFAKRLWENAKARKQFVAADTLASAVLYGEEGSLGAAAQSGSAPDSTMTRDGKALVHRSDPWCVCMSAYCSPVMRNRWIQDRQNLVSIFHQRTGLILGGGNTKLQPLWSTFTVGNPDLLFHKPGNEKPEFREPAGLIHVPSSAQIDPRTLTLALGYGQTTCSVAIDLMDTSTVKISYRVDHNPANTRIEAHVPLMPAINKPWRTASGRSGKLTTAPLTLSQAETGGWFEHDGWRITMPAASSLRWPALPHDPYKKDGRAEAIQGRIAVTLPFGGGLRQQDVVLKVL